MHGTDKNNHGMRSRIRSIGDIKQEIYYTFQISKLIIEEIYISSCHGVKI